MIRHPELMQALATTLAILDEHGGEEGGVDGFALAQGIDPDHLAEACRAAASVPDPNDTGAAAMLMCGFMWGWLAHRLAQQERTAA